MAWELLTSSLSFPESSHLGSHGSLYGFRLLFISISCFVYIDQLFLFISISCFCLSWSTVGVPYIDQLFLFLSIRCFRFFGASVNRRIWYLLSSSLVHAFDTTEWEGSCGSFALLSKKSDLTLVESSDLTH